MNELVRKFGQISVGARGILGIGQEASNGAGPIAAWG